MFGILKLQNVKTIKKNLELIEDNNDEYDEEKVNIKSSIIMDEVPYLSLFQNYLMVEIPFQ